MKNRAMMTEDKNRVREQARRDWKVKQGQMPAAPHEPNADANTCPALMGLLQVLSRAVPFCPRMSGVVNWFIRQLKHNKITIDPQHLFIIKACQLISYPNFGPK